VQGSSAHATVLPLIRIMNSHLPHRDRLIVAEQLDYQLFIAVLIELLRCSGCGKLRTGIGHKQEWEERTDCGRRTSDY
jgi:hypothetical protein